METRDVRGACCRWFALWAFAVVTSGCSSDGGVFGASDAAPDEADAGAPPPDAAIVVAPSNGDVVGGLEATGLTIGISGTFDTTNECATPSRLGRCAPVSVAGPDLCVCRADHVELGDLEISGERALVILAWRDVDVLGDVVLVAGPGQPGPGAWRGYAESEPGVPGAGGSFGTAGAGTADATWGSAELVPLEGGMSGQASGASTCDNGGGGGGGALQITAGERILVTGNLSAGGGGGGGGRAANWGCSGGSGGGSGGALLIEAPAVEIAGTITANGGAGGGAGGESYGGGSGQNGRPALSPATGGDGDDGGGCPLYGYTSGGWGGLGAASETEAASGGPGDTISGCIGGPHWVGIGGAGGGLGRIRINSTSGCLCTGSMSPMPSLGELHEQ